MTPDIQMSAPDITQEDEEAVVSVLRTGILGLGPAAEEFERLCAGTAGVDHAVAVSSGTAGLHLILLSLGIGTGDEVLVPSFTFAASVNAILYTGATPVFVDIEPDTFNIDAEDIRAKRTPRTKAVMVVDVFGHPAEWDEIEDAAEGLFLVDDSCEALGATYKDRPIGSFGNAGCFAFYPNKQITTGEGGMIVTDDARLADTCRSLRNQGRSSMGAWLEHERLGFNYRMDEMSAALGVSQIGRLREILRRRDHAASLLTERLSEFDWLRSPVARPHVTVSWFVYVITLARGIRRDALIDQLEQRGVPSRAYFSPIHLQPYMHGRLQGQPVDLPTTEAVASTTLALPFHTNLAASDVERVAAALTEAVG
jgi:perosamine synthetase